MRTIRDISLKTYRYQKKKEKKTHLGTPSLAGSLDSSPINSLLTGSTHVLDNGVETQLAVELVIFLLVLVV